MTVGAGESDAEAIGCAQRYPEAFAALFDRHYRKIHAYAARRLGDALAVLPATEREVLLLAEVTARTRCWRG